MSNVYVDVIMRTYEDEDRDGNEKEGINKEDERGREWASSNMVWIYI